MDCEYDSEELESLEASMCVIWDLEVFGNIFSSSAGRSYRSRHVTDGYIVAQSQANTYHAPQTLRITRLFLSVGILC